MRRMLAPGILAMAMLGVAGMPTCDSGGLARAEYAAPALKKSDRLRGLPARDDEDDETALHPYQPAYQTYLPPRSLEEPRRGPLRGDFWTDREMSRIFDPPAASGW